MGFLDRFKHENKNETNREKLSKDNSNSFWMNQQAVVPYDDITEKCADEYFLQKIIEEDSDIHRRGFAVYCLNTFVCDNNRNESFSKIMGYDLSLDDWHDVRDDYADLVNAINHFGRLTTPSGNFWESCVVTGSLEQFGINEPKTGKAFVIPFDDLRLEKFISKPYLKDVIKNDDNLHRRTAALFLIVTLHNSDDFEILFENLTNELNISENDLSMILDDFALLLMAKGEKTHIILGI